jgi:hypothetical protein
MNEIKYNVMASTTNCGVCATPLVYATESVAKTCIFCGKEEKTMIYCPAGHYICDSCHSKAALEVLRQVLSNTRDKDPAAILEQVMSHPAVPMHGPEHHVIVPGAIVAAVRNTGYSVPDGAVEKALERASKVPGGWCGLYGDCGAAVGVGIAVSVITGATPLTGKPRTLALAATTLALSRMLDDQPRCCKRASRIAVRAATEFLRDRLRIALPQNIKGKCAYTLRNQECAKGKCPFFKDHPA